MKHQLAGILYSALFLALLVSCNNQDKKTETAKMGIKEENISYGADSVKMNGFIAYDSGTTAKRPIVVIVPEWWGLNDYPKMRARELAKLGYFAIAMDMYGNGAIADNPGDAQKMSGPFYMNPAMAKPRFEAAVAKATTFPEADASKVAAIGYCFGGAQVLNMAKMGEDLKGVVSFHGNLNVVPADKNLLKAKILVCHGGDDKFVLPEEVQAFRKQMDSIGADYNVIVYPGATHSFTNPASTANGLKFNMPIAYNAAADSGSWKAMQEFFGRIFK